MMRRLTALLPPSIVEPLYHECGSFSSVDVLDLFDAQAEAPVREDCNASSTSARDSHCRA